MLLHAMFENLDPSKALTEDRVAEMLGKSPETLRQWRRKGIGPPWHQVRLSPRYDPGELQKWWRSNLIHAPEQPSGKNPNAVALGKRGARKGGLARTKSLTPERRKEIAVQAAQKRWAKERREVLVCTNGRKRT